MGVFGIALHLYWDLMSLIFAARRIDFLILIANEVVWFWFHVRPYVWEWLFKLEIYSVGHGGDIKKIGRHNPIDSTLSKYRYFLFSSFPFFFVYFIIIKKKLCNT